MNGQSGGGWVGTMMEPTMVSVPQQYLVSSTTIDIATTRHGMTMMMIELYRRMLLNPSKFSSEMLAR